MNSKEISPSAILAIACVIGIGLIGQKDLMLNYVGAGLCFAGAMNKLITIPGAIIFFAGIAGFFYFDSFKPPMAAAAILALWFISTYVVAHRND